MERPHGQLRAGLTDRLCSDDADRFTDLNRLACGKVDTVALAAHAVLRTARKDGTDLNPLNAVSDNNVGVSVIHHFIFGNKHLAGFFIDEVFDQIPPDQAFMQRLDNFFAFLDIVDFKPVSRTAVILTNDNIL